MMIHMTNRSNNITKKRKAKEDEDIEMRENVGRDKKSDEEPIEKIILVEDEEIKEGDEIKF